MGTDEQDTCNYLKQFPKTFVSAIEVCKRAGGRKRFSRDRDWARPVLRRLEVEGFVESNEYGQFKLADFFFGGEKKGGGRKPLDRAREAISQHVLSMTPEDDTKPFSTLVREALNEEYASETSWLKEK